MAHVDRLTVYPVKGLDGVPVPHAPIRASGTLADDRAFALVNADGDTVSAKQAPLLHELHTDYDRDSARLTVEPPADSSTRESTRESTRTFDLDAERGDASDWFSAYLDADVALERDDAGGFVDRPSLGPSVVSTATLEELASWFDGLSTESVRRRLRANVEVADVPAFWEDRFLGEDAPAFRTGGVRFDGVKPCGRCVVPARDPDSGDPLPGFRERFVEHRRETLPDWVDESAFDHHYAVMLLATIPETDRGGTLEVGDDVEIVAE